MNQGKYVFAQLTELLPQRVFDRIVSKHNGNKYVRHFTCWNQLMCMVFGQVSGRESLRDLLVVVKAHQNKSYHLGLSKNVTLSNLAKANQNRSCVIFEQYANHLISLARSKGNESDLGINGRVYAFDSTTIDLCLGVFWWATFRKAKAGIKLHTLFDITTQIPAFVHFSEADVHDVNAMDYLIYEPSAYYIFDRAYVDFNRLYTITTQQAFFVVRAKSNLKFNRMYSCKVDKSTGVKTDQTGKLSGFYTSKDYPDKIRRVKFHDTENDRTFVFLTNNFDLTALQIALLYKQRWHVELFFKWIKQHLKVKSFWGTTENAVRIQINAAIITYCLVSIFKNEHKIEQSTYEIIQILGVSLLDKTPVKQLFTIYNYNNVNERNDNQLKINLF
ncbi:IS4 family transposase [Galbibacter orientalis]|uniref:IS4 family transposase n=1 Tax=Galbibacter orientalis TaxID=453852 RepID=UPI00307FD217